MFLASTSTDTCATPPRALDGVAGSEVGSGPSNAAAFGLPRFSPDGSRVAYIRTDTTSRIASIGFDGSQPHNMIAPVNALTDGAPDPDSGRFVGTGVTTNGPRPVWVDGSTIAWMQVIDGGWQIVTASDADNSTPQLLMSCTSAEPSQFDVLPGGGVIVAQQLDPDGGSTLTGLVTYTITPGTKACVASKTISTVSSFGGTVSAQRLRALAGQDAGRVHLERHARFGHRADQHSCHRGRRQRDADRDQQLVERRWTALGRGWYRARVARRCRLD